MDDRLVSDWMTRDPVAVSGDAAVATAAQLMMRHHYRHLPVLTVDGRLAGLLDDAAVFGRGEWKDHQFRPFDARDRDLRVSDAMFDPPVTVLPHDPIRAALRPMSTLGADCAVVVDVERRPVGILTSYDAVRHAPAVLPRSWTTRELAKPAVVTIARGATVGAALDTMRAHGLRHLVVTEEVAAHGAAEVRPFAVVSWRNLIEVGADQRRTMPIDAVAPPGAEMIRFGAPLAEIAERMVTQKVGCLPVVDASGALVGIVSRTDLMRAVVAEIG
jgi:CBS domain-containing protein